LLVVFEAHAPGRQANDCDRNQQISTVRSPVTYTTNDADNAPTARYKTITSSEKPPSINAETVDACVNDSAGRISERDVRLKFVSALPVTSTTASATH
jgi:hypothetical protein